MISLDELLAARDARHEKQLSLLREHPDQTLVCLTVIMPGSEKRNALSLAVANAAVGALRSAFPDSDIETCDLETGFEAYLLVPLSEIEAKRIAVRIEDTHPLGRLFDIDIINKDGTPLNRSAVDSAPRRCLLCGNEARLCMRLHSHTHEELTTRIQHLVADWLLTSKCQLVDTSRLPWEECVTRR